MKKSIPAFRLTAGLVAVLLSTQGCATYRPAPVEESALLAQAQEQAQGKVKVSAAVLGPREAKKYFGTAMDHKNMQPVWLRIENKDDEPYLFLQQSVDPQYYSPEEAAYLNHFSTAKQTLEYGLVSLLFFPLILAVPFHYISAKIANRKIDSFFGSKGIENNLVMPNETVSGFVFTPLDKGTKEICFTLYADTADKTFQFFVKVPGLRADYARHDFEDRYAEKDLRPCTVKDLPKILEALPDCTENEKGTRHGDPVNLVIAGELEEILTAFAAAKWDETEELSFKTGWQMFRAFLFGKTYRYSPVSPLYLYGHRHDIALQKTRETINQRLHLRLWYSPIRLEGKPVWVGTVSRDIGVRFTTHSWYLTTHKIDPNIDDAREYVLGDLATVKRLARYGFLPGSNRSTAARPAKNLTGDPYFTDGVRTVVEISQRRGEPKSFDWPFPLPDVKAENLEPSKGSTV
ncbi:MAG: LssY C-terminal domain-containing protein [Candidatus Omnitrophota bacterium]